MKIVEINSHTELYHGTSAKEEDIRSKGLLASGTQNGVYLTDNPDLAIDYATSDQERTGNSNCLLITVDLTKLDISLMIPDDDHAGDFETDVQTWEDSLADVDQCVYRGNIPPHAISDIEIVD